jgi:hypothetical protein
MYGSCQFLARAVGHMGGAEDSSLVVGEDVYMAAV